MNARVLIVTLAGALALAVACGGPTRGRDPDIFVQPQAQVVFGRVIVGESARVSVVVRNVGDGPLTVTSVALAGGAPFAVEAPATPFTLDPGQGLPFDVVYTPSLDASDGDLLTILSDDPDEGTLGLPISVGQRGPHLRFDPPVIDWGLLPDRWGGATALLVNDGTEPVTVADVTLASGAEWVLDAGAAAGQTLQPGDSVSVTVTRDIAFQDMINLGIGRVTAAPEMTAMGVPEAHLELRGPPMAVVGPDVNTVPLELATLDGRSSFAPGGAVSEYHWHISQSPGGSRTAAQFEAGDPQVVRDMERCPGGQNVLPQPCFFPDAPGTYVFELRVVDVRPSCALAAPGASCGGAAECCSFDCAGTCGPAVEPEDVCGAAGGCAISSTNGVGSVQVVRAIPDQAVFVSMVWDGAGDLDLHMVRDSASAAKAWTSVPDDTYWNNPQPDWGVTDPTNGMTCMGSADCTAAPYTFCRRPAGMASGTCVDASDDPRLLIDVTSSFGPEAIGMKVPPADVYHVGVHYFPDENMSPRRATLRFYVLGEERFAPGTGPGAPLSLILDRNEFWYAARVVVPAAVDDTTIEGVSIGPGNPQANADPGNYPPIP